MRLARAPRAFFFIVSISLSATAAAAQETRDDFPSAEPNLSIDLSNLLSVDHRIVAAKASLEAARSGNEQAFSVFLPRVSLSSDAGKEVIDSPSTRSSGLDEQRETREKATLTLTQNTETVSPFLESFRANLKGTSFIIT